MNNDPQNTQSNYHSHHVLNQEALSPGKIQLKIHKSSHNPPVVQSFPSNHWQRLHCPQCYHCRYQFTYFNRWSILGQQYINMAWYCHQRWYQRCDVFYWFKVGFIPMYLLEITVSSTLPLLLHQVFPLISKFKTMSWSITDQLFTRASSRREPSLGIIL